MVVSIKNIWHGCVLSTQAAQFVHENKRHIQTVCVFKFLNSIKTKSKYFKLYKQGLISKERNDRFNKTLNKVIRSAKRRYFFNYFETNIDNVEKTWAGIRKLT